MLQGRTDRKFFLKTCLNIYLLYLSETFEVGQISSIVKQTTMALTQSQGASLNYLSCCCIHYCKENTATLAWFTCQQHSITDKVSNILGVVWIGAVPGRMIRAPDHVRPHPPNLSC